MQGRTSGGEGPADLHRATCRLRQDGDTGRGIEAAVCAEGERVGLQDDIADTSAQGPCRWPSIHARIHGDAAGTGEQLTDVHVVANCCRAQDQSPADVDIQQMCAADRTVQVDAAVAGDECVPGEGDVALDGRGGWGRVLQGAANAGLAVGRGAYTAEGERLRCCRERLAIQVESTAAVHCDRPGTERQIAAQCEYTAADGRAERVGVCGAAVAHQQGAGAELADGGIPGDVAGDLADGTGIQREPPDAGDRAGDIDSTRPGKDIEAAVCVEVVDDNDAGTAGCTGYGRVADVVAGRAAAATASVRLTGHGI